MNTSQSQNQLYPITSTTSEDEIDLRQVARALSRRRHLVAIVTGVSILISGTFALTRKPVWEGHFQIVLENRDSDRTGGLSQFASGSQLLSSITGGGINPLKTEVKVLESPSVLQPTYNFVKDYKAKEGEDIKNWTFRNWREKKLKIELDKGTSVLNISYRDTSREIILPVIRKISKDYQLYSGRDRSKSISNGLAFAREQVENFRQKAAASSRALDEFSIRYGIANNGEAVGGSGLNISKLLNANAGMSLINPLSSASSIGYSDSPSSIGKNDALGQLAGINQELIRRQQQYTSRDPSVLALIRERDALRRYIEVTAGGSLTLPGQQTISKEQAQDLLLRFKELNREAKRDISTLDLLERSLMSLQLEQARQTDPWELISTPTLLDRPVAPHKTRIVALGLLAGLVLGGGAALLVDRRTGLVYSEDELKSLIPCPLIKHLPASNGNGWTDAADLLAAGPLAQSHGNSAIALIPIGNIPNEQLQAFSAELRRALAGRELMVSTDLRKTSRCATQLLLTSQGTATRTQLSQLRQKLALQGTPLAGWVLLDPDLNLV